MRSRVFFVSIFLPLIIAACGGGGGGNGSSGTSASTSPADSSPATSGSPGAAQPGLSWSVTNLGAFSENEKSVATGINNAGKIVGFTQEEGNFFHRPFVYSAGSMQAMLRPLREASIQPTLINNSSVITGYTYQPQARDGGGPFVYGQGEYTRLGGGEAPFGINDDGKLVGNLTITTYNPDAVDGSPFSIRRHAYMYLNGTMMDLSAEMGAQYAYGINKQGDIVGGMPDGKAYLYRFGQVIQLGTLPGDRYSLAMSINNNGDVVGVSSNQDNIQEFSMRAGSSPASGWRAFLYQNGVMTDLNAAGGFSMSHAFIINNQGWILGEAVKNGSRFSYLYQDGKFINLNELAELKAEGWSQIKLYGMNDAGQIVGKGTIAGKERALLLTPQTTSAQ